MYSVQGLGQDTKLGVSMSFIYNKTTNELGPRAGNYIKNVLNKAIGEERAQSF